MMGTIRKAGLLPMLGMVWLFLPGPRSAWPQEQGTAEIEQGHETRIEMQWSDGERDLEVRARGEIEFTEDDRDVRRISPGGYLRIEERRAGEERRVEYRATAGGEIQRTFTVDGRLRELDPAARRWVESILLEVIRESGIGAEARVERILAERGADGVLEEISRIRSDNAQRRYFSALLESGSLDPRTVRRVLQQAAREIDSDHHLAELLLEVTAKHTIDATLLDAYLQAANHVESDHHQRRVLTALLADHRLSAPELAAVLASARRLESDHHQAELLLAVTEYPLEGASLDTFLETSSAIDSDHHQRRVLSALLDRGAATPEQVGGVLRSVATIGSDHHRAELLVRIANEYALSGEQREAYLRAASAIGSDHHKSRVLSALLERERRE